MLRTPKAAIATALLLTVTASFLGCDSTTQVPGKTIRSKHLTFVIPVQWEQRPGSLAFRLRRNSAVVRFLAVDEEPAINGSADATMELLRKAFPSGDRVVDVERSVTWQGHRVLELTWHGRTKSGTAVRGEQRFVVFKNGVVAIMWYAPISEWDAARNDMAKVIGGMRFR